jgi:hypothetical protein
MVNPAAKAVKAYSSNDEMSGVTEDADAELDTRGSIRLFVNVAVPAFVVTVPVVGKVNDVVPETVRVVPKLPEMVSVLAALFATPVPPYAAPITEAFHVPEVMVPILAKLDNVVTAVFTKVPEVGNVTDVVPLTVNVVPKLPEMVMVLAALFATPVPP